jgi:hypothetical protein
MKNFLSLPLITLLMFSQNSNAAEFLNVGLRINLKYESFGESCQLRDLFRHYDISLESDDRHVTRAQIKKINVFGQDEVIKLNELETASFDVRTDKNLSWIKSFSASPNLVKKLLTTADGLGASDSCKPPQDLTYDEFESIYFDFGIEEVGHLLPHFIYSKPVMLWGHKSNGDPFRIELTLTQDRT